MPLDENRGRMSEGLVNLIELGRKIDAVTARKWEFERTKYWRDAVSIIESRPNQPTEFVILRKGQKKNYLVRLRLYVVLFVLRFGKR